MVGCVCIIYNRVLSWRTRPLLGYSPSPSPSPPPRARYALEGAGHRFIDWGLKGGYARTPRS